MHPVMRLVFGLVGLVVIFMSVAMALPNRVTVARSVVINAPEPIVFPFLNNLHHFAEWSPWAARDPNLQVSFAGPAEGKGAEMDWSSDQRAVGTGRMEITGSDPNRHVDLAVVFNELEGTSSYDIAPAGSGSKVTWVFAYDTGSNPLRRWRGLMLDRTIGEEYRRGLDKLKQRVEAERAPSTPASPSPPAATPEPGASQSTSSTEQQAQPAITGSSQAENPPAAAPPAAAPEAPAPAPPTTPKKPQRRHR